MSRLRSGSRLGTRSIAIDVGHQGLGLSDFLHPLSVELTRVAQQGVLPAGLLGNSSTKVGLHFGHSYMLQLLTSYMRLLAICLGEAGIRKQLPASQMGHWALQIPDAFGAPT